MSRARAAAAVLAGALALAAPAAGMPDDHGAPAPDGTTTVSIPGKLFAPADVLVLAGQTVTWRNGDASVHNIQADDHSFTSGALVPGASFSQRFDMPGRYSYLCTIHRQMRGVITVAALGLTGPAMPVRSGRTATLVVLAPPGAGSVTLERLADVGPPEVVAEALPDATGHAAFNVTADAPARYRVRAGGLTSVAVSVHVAPAITATARRAGRAVKVRVALAPAQAGAGVVLERYVRERFDWAPLRTARLGADSTAAFDLHTARRLRLRVRLASPVAGYSRIAGTPFVAGRLRHE